MKTLLLLLLVSGLVAESSAWEGWSAFKDKVKDRFGDVGDFFSEIGKKAKDFVTGNKGKFKALGETLKDRLDVLEKCTDCEDGDCNEERNIECEQLYNIYEKVNNFMECTKDKKLEDCGLSLGRGATPPPKRELSKKSVGRPATVDEGEDDDTEQQKQERRVAVLLRALLKKTQK